MRLIRSKFPTVILACLLAVSLFPSSAFPAEWTTVAVDKPGELVLAKPFTRFQLTKDINAEASGLEIVPAPGVTGDIIIDLAGHTLSFANGQRDLPEGQTIMTYNALIPKPGAKSRNVGHFGIFYCRDPRMAPDSSRFAASKWGQGLKRISIISSRPGGRIVQGDGGASYGAAIMLDGAEDVAITGADPSGTKNLLLEVHGPDFFCINCGTSKLVKVSDLIIRHKGLVVTNRHAIVSALEIGEGLDARDHRSLASKVEIDGSPQAGIVIKGGNALVVGNHISQNVTVTNGYGVQGYRSKNVEVADNVIVPKNGRGIHLSEYSSGWDVHGNTVVVRETPPAEYPTNYLTHGIKLEDTSNSKVHDNLVIAYTGPNTSAHALDIAVKENFNNEITGNTFVAINRGDAHPAQAKSVRFYGDGRGTAVSNNRFISNEICIFPGPERAENYTFQGNVFERLKSPAPPSQFMTTCFISWKAPLSNLRLIDNIFEGGASPTDVWVKPAYVVRDALTASNTLEIQAKDKQGNPIQGAKVQAVDVNGHVEEAIADAQGRARLSLQAANYLLEGDGSVLSPILEPGLALFKGTVLTPYALTVTAQGSSPVEFKADMVRPRHFVATLGASPRVEERADALQVRSPTFDPNMLEK